MGLKSASARQWRVAAMIIIAWPSPRAMKEMGGSEKSLLLGGQQRLAVSGLQGLTCPGLSQRSLLGTAQLRFPSALSWPDRLPVEVP